VNSSSIKTRRQLSSQQIMIQRCFILFCFETGSCCVAQAGLELMFFQPQPPKCWHYRYVPLHLARMIFFHDMKSSLRMGLPWENILIVVSLRQRGSAKGCHMWWDCLKPQEQGTKLGTYVDWSLIWSQGHLGWV
jgi:hypothetical protein